MKYTSTILAAVAIANAAPAQPVCNLVVEVVTGAGIWVPKPDPTWAPWSPSSSSTPAAKTTSSSVDPWSAWTSSTSSKPAVKTTTTTTTTYDPTWSVWTSTSASTSVAATTSAATSTTWTKPATTSKAETTSTTTKAETTAYTTTAKATTTTTTTTTEVAKPTATCPASSGTPFEASGSCECSYNVNCGVKTTPTADSKFWERTSGELIGTLGECIAICDENSSCTAVLWVDDPSASAADYHHCWQTSGLPQPNGSGYAQISYKGACSGSCSAGYSA